VVEQTLSWLNHSRCLSKDLEISVSSDESMVKISHIHTLLKRLRIQALNVNMVRRYEWGKGGQHIVDHAPLNIPKSTTILSSIRLDGEIAFTTSQDGTTEDKFLTYLKDVLIPAL